MTIPDPETLVAQHWPLDGPYSPELLASALDTAAELIRYACRATVAGRRSTALRSAPELYTSIGHLVTVAARMGNLANRLADFTTFTLPADPDLRHDQYSTEPPSMSRQMAIDTAFDAAVKLGLARDNAGDLARALGEAHEQLGHLYHEQEDMP